MLGLPEKFTEWRHGQDGAVLAGVDSPKRFYAPCAPTGFGKTACYIAQALLSGVRTCILTATKGLQTQLIEDFGVSGLVDLRGQGNYKCKGLLADGEFRGEGIAPGDHCDAGPCHAGARCSLRTGGCYYFDAVMKARLSQLVVTNYSYWIAQHRYSDGMGEFGLLVMDEAHSAADELAASLEIELQEYDTQTILGCDLPLGEDPDIWRAWARKASAKAQVVSDRLAADIAESVEQDGYPDRRLSRELLAVKKLANRVTGVLSMEGSWAVERRPRAAKLAPIWPAAYAERFLFLNVPKILLVSATIRPKTLQMLGVPDGEFEYIEYPSTFPVDRRPVTFIPSVRVQHNWTELDQRTWVNRIDQIIDRRLDRKGLVHCMSYERRNLILTYSRHRDIMLANDSSNTRTTVEKFRASNPPAVLVSPSITTGWDLPEEDCEYAIIAKVPFPDTRSVITEARTQQDPDYGPYVAMQTIVQASGRGMRSARDRCEVFVVDDHFKWFYSKYKHFAPAWFRQAVRFGRTVPNPLPKL